MAIGDKVYGFGGKSCSTCASSDIVEYDTKTAKLRVLGSRLPQPLWGASAVTDGRVGYIIGGSKGNSLGDFVDSILKFSPESGNVETLSARLPNARNGMAATWHGKSAYLFGGFPCQPGPQACSDVLRFSPDANAVSVTAAKLSVPTERAAAASDGNRIFVFGGADLGSRFNTITRFDASEDRLISTDSILPSARSSPAVVVANSTFYVIGGDDGSAKRSRQVVTFANGTVQLSNETLPSGRSAAGAAVVEGIAYVLGGSDGTSSVTNEIVAIKLGKDRQSEVDNRLTALEARLADLERALAEALGNQSMNANQGKASPGSVAPYAIAVFVGTAIIMRRRSH